MIEPGGVGRLAGALNAAANDGAAEVHLEFSSNGGYVAAGVYLYNHIRALPLRVVIYNTGSVSSIAVAVLAAEERYCSRHAMFMIHPTTMGSAEMSARRLQSTLDAALADDDRTDDILRERSFIPEDVLPPAVTARSISRRARPPSLGRCRGCVSLRCQRGGRSSRSRV